jgi:hypothetical protein
MSYNKNCYAQLFYIEPMTERIRRYVGRWINNGKMSVSSVLIVDTPKNKKIEAFNPIPPPVLFNFHVKSTLQKLKR